MFNDFLKDKFILGTFYAEVSLFVNVLLCCYL